MFLQYFFMSRSAVTQPVGEISSAMLENVLQIEQPYQEFNGERPLWQELTAHHFPYLKGVRNVNFVYEAITHKDNRKAISSLLTNEKGNFNKDMILDKKIHENVRAYLQEKGYDTYADSAAYYMRKNYSVTRVTP